MTTLPTAVTAPTNTSDIEAVLWERPIVTPEDSRLYLTAAYPLLRYVHENQKIVELPVITDEGKEPMIAELKPYYMNRTDPSDVGVWSLVIPGQNDVRIAAQPDGKGVVDFVLTQKRTVNELDIFPKLSADEADVYVRSILRSAQSEEFQRALAATASEKKVGVAQRLGPFVKRVMGGK